MIDSHVSAEYESSDGLKDALFRIIGAAPNTLGFQSILNAAWIDTQLGPMIAIASDTNLYLLEFVDRRSLEREIEQLKDKTKSAIIPGRTNIVDQIENELKLYFSGQLKQFSIPLFVLGSPFQKKVWEALCKIPAGETRSYLDIAIAIGKPSACRAVAQANGANQLAIIIPCHRVINTNGEIGGYSAGITRKKWLIDLEKTRGI